MTDLPGFFPPISVHLCSAVSLSTRTSEDNQTGWKEFSWRLTTTQQENSHRYDEPVVHHICGFLAGMTDAGLGVGSSRSSAVLTTPLKGSSL